MLDWAAADSAPPIAAGDQRGGLNCNAMKRHAMPAIQDSMNAPIRRGVILCMKNLVQYNFERAWKRITVFHRYHPAAPTARKILPGRAIRICSCNQTDPAFYVARKSFLEAYCAAIFMLHGNFLTRTSSLEFIFA